MKYHVYVRRENGGEWMLFTERPVVLATAESHCYHIPKNYKGIEATYCRVHLANA